MSLQPGQNLSHYTLGEKIGEGGMGAVYRARDTRLGREVAIKVLPDEVAKDQDRLARFQREAQLLASLNHPNIAAIHGLEEDRGTPFLVLELVEGEDLAARVSRGAVPVEEALGLARQIAEALEEAHERGIVHRDLKPANIKLTPDGKVKVLDFGLAKAYEAAPGSVGDPSLSPTLTAAATRAGVILGTAAYMSPEQARGATVDKRADIWAFGCVLLEMITGCRTFGEVSISDTLASVLKSEPNWSALPAEAPPALRRLLARCLQKDLRRRLRDIGEARIALEAIASGGIDGAEAGPTPAAAATPRKGLLAAVAAASIVVTTIATVLVMRATAPAPAAGRLEKYDLAPDDLPMMPDEAPVISPDGRAVAFVAQDGLWVRDLDQIEPRKLAGTEGARLPVWSPDSQQIAFGKASSIWRIASQGGQPAIITSGVGEFTGGSGLSWGSDDRIVYSRGNTGLMEVSAQGGDPREMIATVPSEESDLHTPHVLPNGGVLYTAHRLASGPDTIAVLVGDARKTVLQIEGQPIWPAVYSPTGHILYHRAGTNAGLWAVPFSLQALETTGEPFLIDPDGSGPSVSGDGTVVYVHGLGAGSQQLVWLDREGKEIATIGQPQSRIEKPALSPDGRGVAVMARENENWDIWIHDTARGTRTRLTFTPNQDWDPEWTPDGREVVFWDGASRALTSRRADGTGEQQRLVAEDLPDSGIPTLTPDGKTMVFWAKTGSGKQDLYAMSLDGGSASPLITAQGTLDSPALSPDGTYLAYSSDESGRMEVYLTRFPTTEGKWQVSIDGGITPRWNATGDRLYFIQDEAIMEVDVALQPSVQLGSPHRLFTAREAGITLAGYTGFDVSADGDRFVGVRNIVAEGVRSSVVLMRHWAGGASK